MLQACSRLCGMCVPIHRYSTCWPQQSRVQMYGTPSSSLLMQPTATHDLAHAGLPLTSTIVLIEQSY